MGHAPVPRERHLERALRLPLRRRMRGRLLRRGLPYDWCRDVPRWHEHPRCRKLLRRRPCGRRLRRRLGHRLRPFVIPYARSPARQHQRHGPDPNHGDRDAHHDQDHPPRRLPSRRPLITELRRLPLEVVEDKRMRRSRRGVLELRPRRDRPTVSTRHGTSVQIRAPSRSPTPQDRANHNVPYDSPH